MGFYDARCKCGHKIGWRGKLTDKPPCPKCGHRDDPKKLAEDQAKLENAMKSAFTD